MKIFSLVTSFSPNMTSAHYAFPFMVDGEYNKLTFKYKYYPKAFEDKKQAYDIAKKCFLRYGIDADEHMINNELPLNNLITLSVDAPSGNIGNAHRHNNDAEYFVSKDEASFGFYPTEIQQGIWKIVLSTHAVLSPEVKVEVEVYAD